MKTHVLFSLSLLFGLVVIVGLTACNGGGGGGSSVVEAQASKLRDCGVLSTDGRINADDQLNEEESCYVQCLNEASCNELADWWCGGALAATLDQRCQDRCDPVDFECANGTLIRRSSQCDGDIDCAGGSDEQGCPTFECSNGATVPADWKCDGENDCADGSDEQGCPTFTCTNGEKIPAGWECDFDNDCADNSDEIGCAELLCG